MRVFLSHSSKDKGFVSRVASDLGDAQCEYDERSFDYVLNVRAIRDGLQRADIFVYFLSQASISSSFVGEEQRTALEMRGAGLIKKVMIFTLDQTSYRQLPDWLRETNAVQRISNPGLCARKIQAALVRLEAEQDLTEEIYYGRDNEDRALSKILAGAPARTPIALHAVGHYGVGRKTYIRRNLQRLFPRRFATFPEITVSANQGIEELYRQLHDISLGGSLEDILRDVDLFSKLDPVAQVSKVAELIELCLNNGDFLVITDDGGVYTEETDYQPYLKAILQKVDGKGLPAVGFVQTRMMRLVTKETNKRSYHQYLSTLEEADTRHLLGLFLKQVEVDYTDQQILQISETLDGHPFNIKFAATYAAQYGLDLLIADPSELIEWKRKRAEDFLNKMTFSEVEGDILCALTEYRYLATETLFSALSKELQVVTLALRRLQEFSCVERREGYCHIAPPLRDALRRDARFARSDQWKQQIGRSICDAISGYRNDDDVSISILDGAVLASARGNGAAPFLSALILPSHLLRIARDHYDAGKRGLCIEFCEKAWASRGRLPYEAQIELLRLWGLSTVRVNDENGYRQIVANLKDYSGKVADRIKLFLEGFYLRNNRRPDEAEKKFLSAWNLAPKNQSINRELSNLLAKQRRYSDAEKYARGAYEQEPTNPYVIDVMVEVLLGKQHQGLYVDAHELAKVTADLERYGDAPGSSFHLMRKAQAALVHRNYTYPTFDVAGASLMPSRRMIAPSVSGLAVATTATPTTDTALAKLAEYRDAARGAYAAATEEAFRNDSAVFTGWCTGAEVDALPAEPATVAAFIEAMIETRKAATIRRYVSTISHMHRAAGVSNPCADPLVRFALRRMGKALTVRQRQAHGITRSLLDRMLGATGTTPRDMRNRALLAVAYDSLARRSELVALQVEDLQVDEDGHGSLLIRRSKTDQLGEGSARYLAPDTVQLVQEWVATAGLTDGPLFRATRWNGVAGGSLAADDIGRIFKGMATAAKVPAQDVTKISGHSTRVGAAKDMAAADIGMASIMQAGGWKTPAMVGRYTSQQDTRRSGAAKLAERQGRAG